MWETWRSIADWVCFKTQTLLAILRTQNQPQEESCVFLEVEHLFLSVGCARNKLLSRTVLQSLRLFLWMPGWRATLHSKTKAQKVKRRQKVGQLSDVDYVPTNTHSSQNVSQLYILEDHEAVFKMVIKGRSPTMRRVSRTHRVCSWLVVWQNQIRNPKSKSNTLSPKTNSLTFWPEDVSQEMNGITFFVCPTSWISRCILVAISVIFFLTIRLESRAPSQKVVRRRLRMKALRRRKRSHVWCCASKGARKSLHEVWDLWSIRRMPMKEMKSYKHPGNWCNPTRKCSASMQATGAIRQANVPQASRKLAQEDQNQTESDERKYSDSTSSRKLGASSPELKNMEYTNHQSMSKIFQFLR